MASSEFSGVNNLVVDGINNNIVFFNRDAVRPSVDSIEEFRVLTNAPSAEHGRQMHENDEILRLNSGARGG